MRTTIMTHKPASQSTKQRGSVLLISLVILAALGLMVLSSMRNGVMQTVMAGAAQMEQIALSSAETEAAKIESALDAAITNGTMQTVCTAPGAQYVDAGQIPGYTLPAGTTYKLACVNRKSVIDPVTTSSIGCLDYYQVDVTSVGHKGTSRTVETKYAVPVNPSSC